MDRSEELSEKLARTRRWLAETGARGVLVAGNGAFAWITCGGDNHVSLGTEAGAASVLISEDRAFVLAANNEMRRIVDEEIAGLELEPITWPWHRPARARTLVDLLVAGPVKSDLGQLGLARADGSFAELRYTLLPPEIERYRRLGRDAAEVVDPFP